MFRQLRTANNNCKDLANQTRVFNTEATRALIHSAERKMGGEKTSQAKKTSALKRNKKQT
jgi:hypothetical protein